MPSAPYYINPVVITRDASQSMRPVSVHDKMRRSAGAHTAILGANEIFRAACDYVIVFADDANQVLTPHAVLGVREGENLFVDPAGQWRPGCHIPAFVHRYPFIPATTEQGELIACIDSPCLETASGKGHALFGDNGEPSAQLAQALGQLADFDREVRAAQTFAKRLQELGVLVERAFRFDLTAGPGFVLNGLKIIDEARFDALDDTTLLDLARNGYFKLAVAHLISLGNLGPLMDRMAERLSTQALTSQDAADQEPAEATTAAQPGRPELH